MKWWTKGFAAALLASCALVVADSSMQRTLVAAETEAVTNQQIAERIATAIASAPELAGYDIDIEYVRGVCTLRGTVSRPEDVQKVVAIVKKLNVAKKIVTDLSVRDRSVKPAAYRPNAAVVPAAMMAGEAKSEILAPPAPEYRFRGRASQYEQPYRPPFAWPLGAPYPNYSAVQYPRLLHGCEFPYIGPFYPFPEPPLGWRKVTLTWHDGFWMVKFGVAPFGRYHY